MLPSKKCFYFSSFICIAQEAEDNRFKKQLGPELCTPMLAVIIEVIEVFCAEHFIVYAFNAFI